jgi:hypothetical protein
MAKLNEQGIKKVAIITQATGDQRERCVLQACQDPDMSKKIHNCNRLLISARAKRGKTR